MRATLALILLLLLTTAGGIRPAAAQSKSQNPLLSRFGKFQKNEAFVGDPFGVGKITISITEADRELFRTNGLIISEAEGRIHYPVFASSLQKKVLDVLAGESGEDMPKSVIVYFLFTGDTPFTAKVYTSTAQTIRVEPGTGRPLVKNLLTRTWWREYNAVARQRRQQGDYPPVIETYLTAMLGQRLQLPKPLLERTSDKLLVKDQVQQIIDFMLGAEKKHLKLMRETMDGRTAVSGRGTLPLPEDAFPTRPALAPEDDGPEIEEIAGHVPEECFYIRFGQWQNQVWLTRLVREYGGDIGRMLILRGIESLASARFEEQLGLEQDPIAETFGQTVIADFVLFGRDLYLTEGAALGVVFEERNSLLASQLRASRAKILEREKKRGATEETLEIMGNKVHFLSTADNRIRSFYAKDGKYHLMTNCKALVKRFFECGKDRRSLKNSIEFRQTRASYPVGSDDTVFCFMPSNFFRGMLSSRYQIENSRRQQAVVDIELLQLAAAAAKGEGLGDLTVDQLITNGFLPENFSQRVDFSGPISTESGGLDSLRGARGCFLPIPDVPIRSVTEAEAEKLEEQNALIREEWKDLVPLVVSMKRERLDRKGRERISYSANITSLLGNKTIELLKDYLGPPTQYRHGTTTNDIVNVHASMGKGILLQDVSDHQIFLAVQNEPTPVISVKPSGFFSYIQLIKGFPGYLGAWPKPGYLDAYTPQLAKTDEEGFSSSRLLGLHRMQTGEYSVVAFDKNRLLKLRPKLGAIKDESFGQVHVYVGDVTQSELVPLINTLFYQRALQASLGNIKLLNAMTQQLGVAPEDAKARVENLIDGKLVCSLEGNYKTIRHPNGRQYWTSDLLPPVEIRQVPEDYLTYILRWFQGAKATLLIHDDQVMISGHADMLRQKSGVGKAGATEKDSEDTSADSTNPAALIPGLNSLFGGGKSKTESPKDAKNKKEPPTEQNKKRRKN